MHALPAVNAVLDSRHCLGSVVECRVCVAVHAGHTLIAHLARDGNVVLYGPGSHPLRMLAAIRPDRAGVPLAIVLRQLCILFPELHVVAWCGSQHAQFHCIACQHAHSFC